MEELYIECRDPECRTKGCPGVARHCDQNEHCNITDDNCQSEWRALDDQGNPVHPMSCCVCGDDHIENWVLTGTEGRGTIQSNTNSKSRTFAGDSDGNNYA